MHFDPSTFVAAPELVAELDKLATPVDCRTDRILFLQGDMPVGIYILRGGAATLTMSAASQPVMKIETGAGSLLGLPALLGDQPYSLTATAHKDAKVAFLSNESFSRLMNEQPHLSLMVLQVLAAEVRAARSALYE